MRRPLARSGIEALRRAAVEATDAPEPDWSRLDQVLARAAREAASAPTRRRGAVLPRIAVAAAAAAGIAAALWLLPGRGTPPSPPGVSAVADRAPARRDLLAFGVTDSLGIRPSPAPAAVREGEVIAVPAAGELRLALGPGGLVELGPGTSVTAWSLDEHTATLSVERGTLLVDVPPGALVRDLAVAADRTTFRILFGTAEFSVLDGALQVRVFDGEIETFGEGEPARLAGGVFRRGLGEEGAPVPSWTGERWSPGEPPGRGALAERPLLEPTGTLPRGVVRQALDRVTPKIRDCYENVLKRHPRATATITARVRVDAGGGASVTGLSGAWSWPGLGECLTEALGAMTYPPPQGGPVDLILPLRLVPEA